MPSMTVYSSYETLTLFQTIAKYGTDASTFQNISTALKKNEFDVQNGQQNAERLSAKALRGLYEDVVNHDRARDSVGVNGDAHNGGRSPKRRKLSASPPPNEDNNQNEQERVYDLVDKLYARYKDEAIKEIKKEEEAYALLQHEIDALEAEVKALKNDSTESRAADSTGARRQPGDASINGGREPNGKQSESDLASKIDPSTAVSSGPAHARPPVTIGPSIPSGENSESIQSSRKSISAQANQPIPSQSEVLLPQNEVKTPISNRPVSPRPNAAAQHPAVQTQRQQSTAASTSPVPNTQNRPAVRQNTPLNQVAARPPQPHPYPPYAQYSPQWHPQMGHPQYAQHPGYGPPPYYPQPIAGRHPQTPQYQHYPQPVPMQYGPPHGWHGSPYAQYPTSSASTPISRPDSRMSVTHSGSTTPWKKRDASAQRQPSPRRPDRAISPLETDATLPAPLATDGSRKQESKLARKLDEDTPTLHAKPPRRGRPPSKTPSAIAPSRSQSNASRASDIVNDRPGPTRRNEGIKVEPPSTPLPPPSDSDTQKSSGRRGRPRNSTITAQSDPNRTATAKRKRDTISPTPSIKSPSVAPGPGQSGNAPGSTFTHDPSLVLVSKNFAKTSQLLLNELTSHKLAGIFAKPLSERDAPGYKDLVHKPQDLKNIKAAISRGSRAALAAIEALESDDQTEGLSAKAGNAGSVPSAIGNGFYLVTKTADLIPPKAIVNGAQLEMELMRMFANAIMFNPLPLSERGFGRNLKLRKNGGDMNTSRNHIPESQITEPDEDEVSEESDSTTTGGTKWDEAGIISDAREMFDDVGEAVDKWRVLEGERMATSGQNLESSRTGSIAATPSGAGAYLDVNPGRHASVSASSNIGDDEGDGGSTPVPSSVAGTTRKRRRIAEH